jgi:hypothetical protein
MYNPTVTPPDLFESVYSPKPRHRAADLPGMVSVSVEELFPDIKERIYIDGDDLSVIGKATVKALDSVDMTMIRPEHTVKLLSSEHGYSIMGGEPYVTMLQALKETIEKKTGCKDVRLMVGAYRGFRESEEMIEHFDLKRRFGNKVYGYGPYDKGIPIETEVGTLYGIKKIFDGDWFVHSYYDDPREMYFHRMIDRAFKAFIMSYARLETRSVYHMNFGNRATNFLARAIYNAPGVRKKYTFSCFMRTSPAGILSVDADNDLAALSERITVSQLKNFGKIMRLFNEIDECIAVIDGNRWTYYNQSGGVIFGVLMFVKTDPLDLRNANALGAWIEKEDGSFVPQPVNPAIKAVISNQSWPGISLLGLGLSPVFIVGEDQTEMWKADHSNLLIGATARTASDLQSALKMAYDIAKTDKVIIFDGNFGHINCSPSLAGLLKEKAPAVSKEVDEKLFPMWLEQRGLVA